jgi:hypothetical protein
MMDLKSALLSRLKEDLEGMGVETYKTLLGFGFCWGIHWRIRLSDSYEEFSLTNGFNEYYFPIEEGVSEKIFSVMREMSEVEGVQSIFSEPLVRR